MAGKYTNIERIKITTDVVHIHTPVHHVRTREVVRKKVHDKVVIKGEDTLRPSGDPVPVPYEPSLIVNMTAYASILPTDFDASLTAPFWIPKGNVLNLNIYEAFRKQFDFGTSLDITVE